MQRTGGNSNSFLPQERKNKNKVDRKIEGTFNGIPKLIVQTLSAKYQRFFGQRKGHGTNWKSTLYKPTPDIRGLKAKPRI